MSDPSEHKRLKEALANPMMQRALGAVFIRYILPIIIGAFLFGLLLGFFMGRTS